MTERPTEPFRREHDALRVHVEHLRLAAREIPGLTPTERTAVVERIVGFLQGELVPHAQAEENVLYPAWSQLVGYPDAAAPMVHDHQAIVSRIEELAGTSGDHADTLQELLYGLHALISVHLGKEEDLQLPVFDAQPPQVMEDLLARWSQRRARCTGTDAWRCCVRTQRTGVPVSAANPWRQIR